jgi:hypothetical protein
VAAAVVIEHLSKNEWQQDCIADMPRAGLRRDRQDPQQHAIGAQLIDTSKPRRFLMIDHIGFPVSDYARSKAFYLKALAPARLYSCYGSRRRSRPVMIPRGLSAPMENLIYGSAAKADWTSRCMSRSGKGPRHR